MNEKLIQQVETMKTQTIGVEVEMNRIERRKAARLAAQETDGQPLDTEQAKGDLKANSQDSDGEVMA